VFRHRILARLLHVGGDPNVITWGAITLVLPDPIHVLHPHVDGVAFV